MKAVNLQKDMDIVCAVLSKNLFNSYLCVFIKQLEILIE